MAMSRETEQRLIEFGQQLPKSSNRSTLSLGGIFESISDVYGNLSGKSKDRLAGTAICLLIGSLVGGCVEYNQSSLQYFDKSKTESVVTLDLAGKNCNDQAGIKVEVDKVPTNASNDSDFVFRVSCPQGDGKVQVYENNGNNASQQPVDVQVRVETTDVNYQYAHGWASPQNVLFDQYPASKREAGMREPTVSIMNCDQVDKFQLVDAHSGQVIQDLEF